MSDIHSTLFRQATIVNEGRSDVGDVLTGLDGRIVAVGGDLSDHPSAIGAIVIDAKDHWLLPGCGFSLSWMSLSLSRVGVHEHLWFYV